MDKKDTETIVGKINKFKACMQSVENVISIPLVLIAGACAWYDFCIGDYIWGIIMVACFAYWAIVVYKRFIKH